MKVDSKAKALAIAAEALRGHLDEQHLLHSVESDQDLGWFVLTKLQPTAAGNYKATAVIIDPATGVATISGYQRTFVDLDL